MNLEFSVPHKLTTKYGDLLFNVADAVTGRIYRVQSENYKLVPSLRVTQDNISQADGSVLHPRWKSGVTAIMQVALRVMLDPSKSVGEAEPACAADLRAMEELLLLHLNSIARLDPSPLVNQRLAWTPTGLGDDRLLDSIQLLQVWDPTYDLNGEEALITFAVESPFPYAINATQITTAITAGATGAVIANSGNCPQSPVVKVNGPFTGFTLQNANDTDPQGVPLKVVYDGTRSGAVSVAGGHYAELDFFRGTIFLDGTSTDLVAGLDPSQTDFWRLNPGSNHVTITGAGCTVLSNPAVA